jgi:hypothetical protein
VDTWAWVGERQSRQSSQATTPSSLQNQNKHHRNNSIQFDANNINSSIFTVAYFNHLNTHQCWASDVAALILAAFHPPNAPDQSI